MRSVFISGLSLSEAVKWGDEGVLTRMTERKLSPEAQRALAEAKARRDATATPPRPVEVKGATGPEPTRYGDWERKGIASDF